jgi:hypothetical protein
MRSFAMTARAPSQIVDDGFAAMVMAIATHGPGSDVVNALSAEALQAHAPFRIDRIYCCKTGHDIGARSLDRIGAIVDSFGEARAIELLPWLLQTAVDMPWVRTDGEALDAHEERDPVGYFVYGAAAACAIHYGDFNRIHGTWKSQEARMRYLADMIKLNELIRMRPIAEVRERNAIWHIYHNLILAQHAPLTVTRLCDYASDTVWADMVDSVKSTMIAFSRQNHHQFSAANYRKLYEEQLSYEAAGRGIRPGGAAAQARGRSNFAKQRRYKASTIVTEATFFSGLEKDTTSAIDNLFAEYGVAGNLAKFNPAGTQTKTAVRVPQDGFKPSASGGIKLSTATLEAATAPSAPSARESFTSLARKMSSAVEGKREFALILKRKD